MAITSVFGIDDLCSTQSGTTKKRKYFCSDCGEEKKTKQSKRCFQCSIKLERKRNRKVKDRPSLEQLLRDVEELGYCGTGRKYDVSDNAIRKWIKSSSRT